MPNYARLAQSAGRVIAAAGVPVTLTRNTLDDYDPTQGTVDTLGANTFTGAGVRDQYALKDIDGTLVRSGDVRIYLSMVIDGGPQPGDQLMMDGDKWVVVSAPPIKPGPIVLLYDVQARKP